MKFINTPIEFLKEDNFISIKRDLNDKILMIDNLVELIVFTPKGSFDADPDFGFEYWNHEYSNIHYKNFNEGYSTMQGWGLYNEVTKKACQNSIKYSLETYEPLLRNIEVSIELNSVEFEKLMGRKILSKYEVSVKVNGVLDDGLGTVSPYEKKVLFYMEPTVKHINI